jgi:hypothetical protein
MVRPKITIRLPSDHVTNVIRWKMGEARVLEPAGDPRALTTYRGPTETHPHGLRRTGSNATMIPTQVLPRGGLAIRTTLD